MLLPIIDIDVCNASDQKLQLAFVEHVDEIRRDEFVESGDEGLKLLVYAFLDPPLDHQTRLWSTL